MAVVAGATEAMLGGQGETAAVIDGAPAFRLRPGEQVQIRPQGRGIVVQGERAAQRFERLTFVPLGADRFVTINGRPYRGVADVYQRDSAVVVVNRLSIEGYLAGVVSAEMGRRTDAEAAALGAQAIVSRTYAIANRARYGSLGYDLLAGVTDQVYGGVAAEQPEGNRAVQATRGLIVTYSGRPISVFFHSTCGYSTASPVEAFRTIRQQRYLRPISDRKPGGGYYCDISPRFRWRVEWSRDTLSAILRRTVPAAIGVQALSIERVEGLRVAQTGPSGRITDLRIRVPGGEIPISGPNLRAVLRTPSGEQLGSTAVQFSQRDDGTIVAAGAGWGHGVGLCQWGSVGRARAGQSYRAIVGAYFPGAAIEKWY